MPIQLVENAVIAGRFKLNRLIGRGGMGSVWQATHLGLDIPCAVKFIEGELSQVAEAQTRFEREAKAAAQLRSPHVVQILDHGVCEGTPYIAMELLDGEDLGKRLQRLGRMHPREITTIMIQVSRALSKAHAVGIVHRDLKPDNIFLVKDDDREIAKVLDFGIAKHNAHSLEGSNTKTGAMLGTPYYMSPEQAQGIKTVDFRSDLWSLAVIVYQCVTGTLPFESEALGDLLMKIIVQPLPVPSIACPDVPRGFDAWWERASSRDPNGRYQSAKEFAESLQLVFGMSGVTDVMDRNQLKAVLGRTPNPGAGGVRTPAAYGATTPHPGAVNAMTPKFAATTGGATAMPAMDTEAPVVPKRGLGIAVAAGAAALMVVAAIGGFVVLRGHGGSEPAAAAAIQAATPPAPAPPAPPPVVQAVPTGPAVASAAPPPAASVAEAPATPEPSKPSSHHSSGSSSKGAPGAPAKPAPGKPAGNAPKDLGF